MFQFVRVHDGNQRQRVVLIAALKFRRRGETDSVLMFVQQALGRAVHLQIELGAELGAGLDELLVPEAQDVVHEAVEDVVRVAVEGHVHIVHVAVGRDVHRVQFRWLCKATVSQTRSKRDLATRRRYASAVPKILRHTLPPHVVENAVVDLLEQPQRCVVSLRALRKMAGS